MCDQSIPQWKSKTLKGRGRRAQLNLTMEGGSGLGTVIARGSFEGSGVEVELYEGEAALGGYIVKEEAVIRPDMRYGRQHCDSDDSDD